MRLLKEITGHKQIVRSLLNTVLWGRVAHAYLFAGPAGVGKETTALAFARALLCACPVDGDACGMCRECRQVEGRNHPDLYFVQPSGSSIKIDQIRGVLRVAPYRPYQGGRKIFIVRQSDLMTRDAANCLLKTLEEPPASTVFILLSGRPQNLLSTILSRCQQVFFKSLPVSDLIQGLIDWHGLGEEDARHAAVLSGGSMGRALVCASGSQQEERREAHNLAGQLKECGPCEALEMAGKTSGNKVKALSVLDMLTCWYRDLLVYRETGEAELLFNLDCVDIVGREAGCYDTARLVEIIKEIGATKHKLEANANTRLAFEALFLHLIR